MSDNRRNDGRRNYQVYHDNGRGYQNEQRYSNNWYHGIDRSSHAGRGVDDSGQGVGEGASMQHPQERSTPGYDGQWRGDESRLAPAIGSEQGLQLGGFSPIERCWLLIDHAKKTNLPEVGDVLLLLVYPSSGCDAITNAVLRSFIPRHALAAADLVLHSASRRACRGDGAGGV